MEQLPSKDKRINIPEEEIEYEYFRSSKPGGQNVNKLNTAVRLRFNLDKSNYFSVEEKAKIKEKLKNKINEKGEIILENEETRSQFQNKNNVYEKLIELISQALEEGVERIPTKISENMKNKRLQEKKKISEKKKLRQIKPEDWL